MINSITLKDYQAHADSTLNFGPGLNTIVGPSNSAKSSAFRGLIWIWQNRPLGESFIRQGQSGSIVALNQKNLNGNTVQVIRSRGKNVNSYILTTNESQVEYTAFGNAPPHEVLEQLNLSDVNVQSQFAPYFLVFDSPGAVATYIRKVTGLQEIDQVVEFLESRQRSVKTTLTDRQASLEEVELQLSELATVPLERLENCISGSEIASLEKQQLSDKAVRLQGYIQNLARLDLEKIQLPEDRIQEIQAQVLVLGSEESELSRKKTRLFRLITELQSLQQQEVLLPQDKIDSLPVEIQGLSQQLVSLHGIQTKLKRLVLELSNLEKDAVELPEIGELFAKKQTLASEYNSGSQRLVRLFEIFDGLQNIESNKVLGLPELTQEINELRAQLTVCCACGSVLTETTKQNLLSWSK